MIRSVLVAGFCLVAWWPGAAAAYDSKCYRSDSLPCQAGPETARNRWQGLGDEHRQLWSDSVAPLELPSYLFPAFSLSVFTAGGGALSPVPFAAARDIASREYSIEEMAQLPDFSYALWDWATGNDTCPVFGWSTSPIACHELGSHMGPLNSSHFVPQAARWFQHYHRIALGRAQACAAMRMGMKGVSRFDAYLQDCDREAFTFEAVAHHFLQDSWSTGHMWQRWGGPEPGDFSALGGGETTRAVGVLLALSVGLVHGAKEKLQDLAKLQILPTKVQNILSTIDWMDPLCAPLDPAQYPVTDVLNPVMYVDGAARRRGVGDMYAELLPAGYPWQYGSLLDCARTSIAEVATAADVHVTFTSSLPDVQTTAFEQKCFGQRVTNESMLLAMGIDGVTAGGTHVRIPFDGSLTRLIELGVEGAAAIPMGGALGITPLTPALDALYRSQLATIAERARLKAIESPFTTELADGGLLPLLGIESNGAYVRDPPASYVDPALPWNPSFAGAPADPANIIARAFHRAHASDWCRAATEADLTLLKVDPAQNPSAASVRCQICSELAGRHIRVGRDGSHYDRAQEPLCSFLVPAPVYLYAEADDGKPDHAASIFCGCAGVPDGGVDGPRRADAAVFEAGVFDGGTPGGDCFGVTAGDVGAAIGVANVTGPSISDDNSTSAVFQRTCTYGMAGTTSPQLTIAYAHLDPLGPGLPDLSLSYQLLRKQYQGFGLVTTDVAGVGDAAFTAADPGSATGLALVVLAKGGTTLFQIAAVQANLDAVERIANMVLSRL